MNLANSLVLLKLQGLNNMFRHYALSTNKEEQLNKIERLLGKLEEASDQLEEIIDQLEGFFLVSEIICFFIWFVNPYIFSISFVKLNSTFFFFFYRIMDVQINFFQTSFTENFL